MWRNGLVKKVYSSWLSVSIRKASSVRSAAVTTTTSSLGAMVNPLPIGHSRVLALFHWLTVPALMGAVATALKAKSAPRGPQKDFWMHRHKSLGTLVGILLVPRMLARLLSKRPVGLPEVSAVEGMVAKTAHYSLYGFMAIMPATGIAMGYFSGRGVPFFKTTLLAGGPKDGEIIEQAYILHKTLGYYGKFLIPIHLGGALGHLFQGHRIFRRINPFRSVT